MKWYVHTILSLLMLLAVSVGTNLWQYRQWTRREPTLADTIRVTDTLTVLDTVPRLIRDTVLRTVSVTVLDSTTGDTMGVASLSMVQRTFTDDSLYTAWVSGVAADTIRPQLDSIRLNLPMHTITIREQSRPRWSFGIQGGMYLTPKGIQPGLGVGFQWNF